jgi:hypothetical protein
MNQARDQSGRTRGAEGRVGVLAVLVALTVAAPGTGQAGTSGFRCPTTGRLISVGASTHEVRTRCREPDEARSTVELRTVRETVRRWVNGVAQEVTQERTVEVPVDEWTYDFGRLLSVTEGQKGSGAEAD